MKALEALRFGGAAMALRPKISRSVSTRSRASLIYIPELRAKCVVRHPLSLPLPKGNS